MVEVNGGSDFHEAARTVVGLLTAAVDGMQLRGLVEEMDIEEMEDALLAFAVISAHVFVPATAHILRRHGCAPDLDLRSPDVDSFLAHLGSVVEHFGDVIAETNRKNRPGC